MKTLAFAAFAMFLISFTFTEEQENFFTDRPISPEDSILIEEFIIEIKRNLSGDEKGMLTVTELDSLLILDHVSNIDGTITYSPDSLFKIVVVKGEGCGAYCNPFWESKLIFTSSERTFSQTRFFDIDRIHILPDNKYLILHSSQGRAAAWFYVRSHTADLISFQNGKLTFEPILYDNPKWGQNTHSYFEITQEDFIDAVMYLEYDSVNTSLNYSYGTDLMFCCDMDSAFIFTGHFNYTGGTFVHKEETKEFIEVND